MHAPFAIPRPPLAGLALLLALVACGGGSAPTNTPLGATAAPLATVVATMPRTAATTTIAAPTPAATATRATVPPASATPPSATTTRAATAAATATRGTPTRAATAVTPAATPRAYAPDDPCAPFAGGVVPPPVAAPPAPPARLCIPAIVVSAPVIPVGVTPDGAMGEPDDLATVGWYAPGPPPGAVGNAAIDGKVDGRDANSGDPRGVFWGLRFLAPGDLLIVVDEAGTARGFRVLGTAYYVREAAPLTSIFGAAPDANLNLITGAGTWVPERQAYDSNLVIFARLVP
jgi:hypothetical protein